VSGWRKTDIKGKPLLKRDLPGALTSTGRFQGTICEYGELDRLLQAINCEPRPLLDAARAAYSQAIEALKPLVKELHWSDLELLVELIFAQSGYRRQSITGETQKTIDIALELPITGETAFVQVKTKTCQGDLDDYVARLNGSSYDRMMYVYHTPPTRLVSPQANVEVINLDDLCHNILKAGLFDWVLRKSG
jgi:hypothetical protein